MIAMRKFSFIHYLVMIDVALYLLILIAISNLFILTKFNFIRSFISIIETKAIIVYFFHLYFLIKFEFCFLEFFTVSLILIFLPLILKLFSIKVKILLNQTVISSFSSFKVIASFVNSEFTYFNYFN